MNTLTLRLALVSLLTFLPLAAYGNAPRFKSLTPGEVAARLKQKNVYVFDNNDLDVFKAGHVPRAKWLRPSGYGPKELPADKSATLVFYCYDYDCTACHEGAGRALELGYKNVFIMPAGIVGWQKAGLAVEDDCNCSKP